MFRFSTDAEHVDGRSVFVYERDGWVHLSPIADEPLTAAQADTFLRHLTVLQTKRIEWQKAQQPATAAELDRARLLGVSVERMRQSDAVDAETAVLLNREIASETREKMFGKSETLLKPKEFEAAAVGSIHAADSPWAKVDLNRVYGGES